MLLEIPYIVTFGIGLIIIAMGLLLLISVVFVGYGFYKYIKDSK